jgi:hypothetical protein
MIFYKDAKFIIRVSILVIFLRKKQSLLFTLIEEDYQNEFHFVNILDIVFKYYITEESRRIPFFLLPTNLGE